MKKRRELTAYEADRRFFVELLDRAQSRRMPIIEVDMTPSEKAAETRGLRWGEHRDAMRAHREKVAELEANKPVIVFCMRCGQPHNGTRLAMAKWRKCCDAPADKQKFCRGCGVRMLKVDYQARYGTEARPGSAAKGWGTYCKCEGCGTQHRAGTP